MAATNFHLTTDWSFNAPREAVWQALSAPEEWPSWWRAAKNVERIADGDENGIGAVRRMTWSVMIWRTALPYTLTFDMRTTRVEPMTRIEGQSRGQPKAERHRTLGDLAGRTAHPRALRMDR